MKLTAADLILALERLGYRRPDRVGNPSKWLKPFGLNVVTVDTNTLDIWCSFANPGGTKPIAVWEAKKLDPNDEHDGNYETQIAYFEAYDTSPMTGNSATPFGFLTKDQNIASACGLDD